jgi:hypothetical protein
MRRRLADSVRHRTSPAALAGLLALATSMTPLCAAPGPAVVRADVELAIAHSYLAIRWAAQKWHLSEAGLDRVANCESGANPYAIGDGGAAVGIFQWHPDSWAQWADPIDLAKGRQNSWASANETARLISMGYWRMWSCGYLYG